MRKKNQHHGWLGRTIGLVVIIIVAGGILLQSVRAVWLVGASSAEGGQAAYAPIILGENAGSTIIPSATAVPSPTPEVTSTLPSVDTPTPEASATSTVAATTTMEPTATESPTATATATLEPTATPTLTATATNTAEPTSTTEPTATLKPTKTPKPTRTPKPTNTPKSTATTAAPTETPTITPTPTPLPPGEELLVYDLNREVTTEDRGFPYGDAAVTAAGNIDWTSPINFADGTMHFRVEIFHQPVPKDMKLQICFWQNGTTLESCSPLAALIGNPGATAEWSVAVSKMYKKDGLPIDWSQPRSRVRVAIKNSKGIPVSDIGDWNWGGDDPDEWYPLDMRFTAVVVEKGAGFSGWGNYP